MEDTVKKSDGQFVLTCFVAFFALIVVVNSIFIYNALKTHSGVVTKQPYEKGLAFNETLEKAKAQPELDHKVSYKNGVLRWALPIDYAAVSASIVRPVQNGYDFEVVLTHMGGGIYEVKLQVPLRGLWTAQLKAAWNNEQFQTVHDFIAE